MIRSEISESRGTRGIWETGAVSGSDVLLARLFLVSVLGAGFISYLFGLSPESLALFPCPIHLICGVQCPGCGMTRACIALARGDISQALRHNPLSLGLVLFAAGYALAPATVRRNWQRLTPAVRATAKWTAFATVLVFWISRILA